MSRKRDFCFTINNPGPQDIIELKALESEASFIIYGHEVGESGTPHLQGFVMFTNPRTIRGVTRILSRAHVEGRKGTVSQAIDYCKKDGHVVEWGTRPAESKTTKERYTWCIDKAKLGLLEEIECEEPGFYLRYLSTFRSLRKRTPDILGGDLENEWWYGDTGTGKSRKLWEDHPGHFCKPLNKWWDGYEDEDVVGIEEVDPISGKWLGSFLKIWSDRYPFTAEIKGGTLKKIRPLKFVVTSNYTIEECFPNSQDWKPLKRRFKVTHFDSLIRGE